MRASWYSLLFPRKGKARPGGLAQGQRDAAGLERGALCKRFGNTIEPQQCERVTSRGRSDRAKRFAARDDRRAGGRRSAIGGDRHHAAARGPAMLHARDHFLADEAALLEVDAAELVHIGFMREGIVVGEV